jgi:hypothetical protein
VKKFQRESGEPPLRVGDYRVCFTKEHPDISASTQSSIAARPTADARPILSSEVFVCSTHTTAPSYPTSAHRPMGAPTRPSFSLFLHFRSFSAEIFASFGWHRSNARPLARHIASP